MFSWVGFSVFPNVCNKHLPFHKQRQTSLFLSSSSQRRAIGQWGVRGEPPALALGPWFLWFPCRVTLKGRCAHWAKEPCPWGSLGGPAWGVGTRCASLHAPPRPGAGGGLLLDGETSRPWPGMGRPGPLLSYRAPPTHPYNLLHIQGTWLLG